MDKTDIKVMEHMLADRMLVPIRKRIEASARQIVHQFVHSTPKPKPNEVAKIVFETEVRLEVLYGIIEKIQEYKYGKQLKMMTKKDKRVSPKGIL